MASSTRQALKQAKAELQPMLGSVDLSFATDLFAIAGAVASSAQLRSILSDPSAEVNAKSELVVKVFGKHVGSSALEFAKSLTAKRWSRGSDLVAGFEELGVIAVAAVADKAGELGNIEAGLFAFVQAIESDSELQMALGNKAASDEAKTSLVNKLVAGKLSESASILVRQAVVGARGRRVSQVIETFGKLVSGYAERLVATVTVAKPLDAAQLDRLQATLTKTYGQSLRLNQRIDESIIGGVKVQVGEEIIDGSVASRLINLKQQLLKAAATINRG